VSPRALLARFAAGAVGALVLLGVLAGAVGVLAYGTGPTRSGELEVEGLAAAVTVAWPDGAPPVVEAADEAGLWAGLGYVHAADAAWAMTLWRQVALGELAAWLPQRTALDRHARTLGFAALARQSYEAMPAEERAPLDAYAAGVQRALAQPGVAQRDEFVLLDVRPAPWEPWHALAVERLLAWLGTPAPGADSAFAAAARADTALGRFVAADSSFRAYLGLGGFAHARAFATRLPGGGPTLAVEQPWGSSALPLVREVVLRLGGRSTLAATVPGTLALPAGHADDRAWVVFPTSTLTVGRDAGPAPPPVFDRLVNRAGDETLLTIPRGGDGLHLAPAPRPPRPAPPPPAPPRPDTTRVGTADTAAATRRPPAPRPPADRPAPPRPVAAADTAARATAAATAPRPPPRPAPPPAWRVRWRGFAPGADLGAWRALLTGAPPVAFVVFRGDGLVFERTGGATVLGAPPVRRALPEGVFVAAAEPAAHAGARLAAVLTAADSGRDGRAALTPLAVLDDAYSPWAAARLPGLVGALGPREALDDSLRDPYAFLRGWDARYTPDAIGASLFELWVATYRATTGRLPPVRPDSADAPLLRQTLSASVERLRAARGPEASAWRWELVQPGGLAFPVWTTDDTEAAGARYTAVESGRGGHPTALRTGPSLTMGGVPAVWTMWASATAWAETGLRRPAIDTGGFLARARSGEGEPDVRLLRRDARPERTLTLVPRRRDG
jgi:hypothetical protein